jgi:membrane protease YdiL (CAAX protease family)
LAGRFRLRLTDPWAPRVALVVNIIFLVSAAGLSSPACAVSAASAGFLSVVPGLGEICEGRVVTGLAYLGATVGLGSLASRLGGISANAGAIAGEASTSLYFYQMYAAYRDGHPSNQMYGKSNVFDDYTAAFNPRNAWDLKVVGFDALAAQGGRHGGGGASYNPLWLVYWGVGVQQEEALYRGFLYPVFTSWFGGAKIPAALVTSMLDSAQHALYMGGALSPPVFLMRTALFSYLTWVYTQNKYNLPRNIFAHAWFDYLLRTPGPTKDTSTRLTGVRPPGFPGSFQGWVGGLRFTF